MSTKPEIVVLDGGATGLTAHLIGQGYIVHQYQRDLLEMLEQHTPSDLIIQHPRHSGKQAMFKLMKGLHAKAHSKVKPPTQAERHAKRYPAMQLHPEITAERARHWMPKPYSPLAVIRSWNLALVDFPQLSGLVVKHQSCC